MSGPELPLATSHIISLKDWVTQLQNSWPEVSKTLEEERETYKKLADKKQMKPKDFKIGSHVYHSTKYLQSRQPSKKLGPKYIGTFPIKRI